MVEYLRHLCQDLVRALLTAPEVGHQHLDRGLRQPITHRSDGRHIVRSPPVVQIIPRHRCDHNMAQSQGRRSVRDLPRLLRVQCARHTRCDSTEPATTSAHVTQYQKCRRTVLEASAKVGAEGTLAHCVQTPRPQQPPHLRDRLRLRQGSLQPLRLTIPRFGNLPGRPSHAPRRRPGPGAQPRPPTERLL